MTTETGRPFLFAFLAVVLVMFEVGIILDFYATPAPSITCNTITTIPAGANPGCNVCLVPSMPAKTLTSQFYFGEDLTILGRCSGLIAVWSKY